jgi:hypothetical protein
VGSILPPLRGFLSAASSNLSDAHDLVLFQAATEIAVFAN